MRLSKTSRVQSLTVALTLVLGLCASCGSQDKGNSRTNDNNDYEYINSTLNESITPVTTQIQSQTESGSYIMMESFGDVMLLGNNRMVHLNGRKVKSYTTNVVADGMGNSNVKTWFEQGYNDLGHPNNPFATSISNIKSGSSGATGKYVISTVTDKRLYKAASAGRAVNSIELVSTDPSTKQEYDLGSGAYEIIRINAFYDGIDEMTTENIIASECNDATVKNISVPIPMDMDFFDQYRGQHIPVRYCTQMQAGHNGSPVTMTTVGFSTMLRANMDCTNVTRVNVVYKTDSSMAIMPEQLLAYFQQNVLSTLQKTNNQITIGG